MFHCSRGFGHQVATDYLQIFLKVMESKYGIKILDRELACAPDSRGQGLFCRDELRHQCLLPIVKSSCTVSVRCLQRYLDALQKTSGMHMVDVAHNTTAKLITWLTGRANAFEYIVRCYWAFGPGMEDILIVTKLLVSRLSLAAVWRQGLIC